MEPGATLPADRPQRRDQHHPRQPPLDGDARGGAPSRICRANRRRTGSDHPAGDERQRLVRQCAGVLPAERHVAAPRAGDARSGEFQREEPALEKAQELLRIPLDLHGAVGRSGGDHLLRRTLRGRHARPQRTASGTLPDHARRTDGHRLGDGRTGYPGQRDRIEGAPRAGQDPDGRHRTGADPLRRRDQAPAGRGVPLRRVAARQPDHPAPHHQRTPRDARGAPLRPIAAGLRLRPRGDRPHSQADGHGRGRPDRLDGRRHAAGRAVGTAAALLQLLPTTVRPGDQPADGLDPRGAGHVADQLHRRRAQEHPQAIGRAVQGGDDGLADHFGPRSGHPAQPRIQADGRSKRRSTRCAGRPNGPSTRVTTT